MASNPISSLQICPTPLKIGTSKYSPISFVVAFILYFESVGFVDLFAECQTNVCHYSRTLYKLDVHLYAQCRHTMFTMLFNKQYLVQGNRKWHRNKQFWVQFAQGKMRNQNKNIQVRSAGMRNLKSSLDKEYPQSR